MEVRGYEDRADAAGIVRAHGLAWRRAYGDIFPAPVLERIPVVPDPEHVRKAHEKYHPDAEMVAVAVADGPVPGPTGGEDAVDPAPVAGYAYVRVEETKPFVGPDEAGLKELYVHPEYWGQGVGTALLEWGLELLPGDVAALKLEVLADNDRGRSFYEARGFVRVGETVDEVAGEEYDTAIYTRELS